MCEWLLDFYSRQYKECDRPPSHVVEAVLSLLKSASEERRGMTFEEVLIEMRQGAIVKRKRILVSYYISWNNIVMIKEGKHTIEDFPLSQDDITARDWEVVGYVDE